MIRHPHVDWFALSPSLALTGRIRPAPDDRRLRAAQRPARSPLRATGFLVVPRRRRPVPGTLAAKTPHAAAIVHDAMYRDRWGSIAQVLIAGSGAIAVLISFGERWREEHIAEYYALLTAAGAGMMFFVQASNLMTLFLGLEWFSVALYVLTAIDIDLIGSLEAGLNTWSSVRSARRRCSSARRSSTAPPASCRSTRSRSAGHQHDVMLVIGLAMIIAGLAFKPSSAPFHMWTPDVYQGSPTPVTAFMASATKIAAFAVIYRIVATAFPQDVHQWRVGVCRDRLHLARVGEHRRADAEEREADPRVLVRLACRLHADRRRCGQRVRREGLIYYLIPYCGDVAGRVRRRRARERELGAPVTLDNLAGFGWERPFLGVAMWVFMLGFLGFPLTGGFIGKFYVFAAAYRHGWWWLIVAGVIATMISAYYYLGIVRAMYFRDALELQLAPAGGSPPRERCSASASRSA